MQCIAQKVADGALKVAQIDEHTISSALYTATYPDPDLIIRTSGEMRLSNFLLWQASYAEFYFPEVLWPDFTEASFDEALEQYALRDRRFGRVSSDEPKDEGLDA
jgi:undecaprenyl diphosphate synthase